MKILIDGDACPVIKQTERIAKERGVQVVIICDNSHVMKSDYSEIIVVDKGMDAVDFAIIQKGNVGDIVVTQDYGVAAMVLGKGLYAIHQSGKLYTNENIDTMLFERHMAKKARRSSRNHSRGPKKRTAYDDELFEASFRKLLDTLKS